MSLVPKVQAPLPTSWCNLRGIFSEADLGTFFESLENRYHVSNEVEYFSSLVNMSTATAQPFHRWIRYREGYAGELVKEVLRRFPVNPSTHFVLDPMCGSGSSLVACGQLGIDALGLDVNGYAILSSSVKSHSYSNIELKNIKKAIKDIKLYKYDESIPKNELNIEISKYFPANNWNNISKILHFVKKYSNNNIIFNYLKLGLLAMLEDCSNRKKDGNGLATRPAPVENVYKRYFDQLDMMYEDISNITNSKSSTRLSLEHSALDLISATNHFKNKTQKNLGSIIYSPPYANSFDYFESYKMELVVGEYIPYNKLTSARKVLIRNYRIKSPHLLPDFTKCIEQLCSEIAIKIPEKEKETGVRDGRTRLVPNMLRAYFQDMKKVIQNSYDALDNDGSTHIVIDQSAYVGVPIPTDLIFAYIAEQIGFKVESIINCRRANTSGQQLKKFPYLKLLLRESIVNLKKSSSPS